MIHLSQFLQLILSGIIAFVVPFLIFLFQKQSRKMIVLLFVIYLFVVAYETLFTREMGAEHRLELTPFWSYAIAFRNDIRYQIYMNIFLFIPLGFLIPFSSKKTFLQTLILGCCLSIGIELLQFIFALGLCEIDDVIHNTLGCIIGYWYWFGLSKLEEKLHRNRDLKGSNRV